MLMKLFRKEENHLKGGYNYQEICWAFQKLIL